MMKEFWCESDEIYYSDSINFDLVIIINTKLNSESFLRNKKIHASVVSFQRLCHAYWHYDIPIT